jgi:predicted ATPase/class 3 adenylate cyclase
MRQLERIAPSGDVTFLFSDIEGSTARWKMYPDAMPSHLGRHDDLLRASIEQNGGSVFKTVGDEFCSVFVSAEDAITAAVEAQRALAPHDWSAIGGLRVRMAVHTGAVTPRDGDYFGSTVNRVARLLSAGHGGQILISADAVQALDEQALSRISLRDLGRHRLKDFPDLESIYQLLAPDLPEIFPPLRTIAERPSNLPQHLPPLLGREHDLHEVAALLREHHLVSLLGAGGVGKTALALQTGTDLLNSFDDGAWIAELAPVDSDSVASTLAGVFGITSLSGGSVLDALVAHLKSKNLLLILDNCEHVIEAAMRAVDVILRGCGGVTILTTSRAAVGVSGETVYRLPVLAVPPEHAATAQEVGKYGACALFEERARSHVAGFRITDENAKIVARICRRLDGIPLAIELATPRLRVLSAAQLLERLNERFRLLTGGSRASLPHHQTLRALIQWSYELLSENERVLLRRSSLFPGGWSIGAAVEVCADESLEEWDILDHLSALVDKSLVTVETNEDEPRYRMLESTREFALERLDESGEHLTVARKHAAYFLSLANRADAAWPEISANAWIAPLNAELDNLRAALSWSVAPGGDALLGLRLFGALEAFWWDAQPIEGRRRLEELRAAADAANGTTEAARYWLSAAGIALSLAQEKTAAGAAEHAFKAYRDLHDAAGAAASQRCLGAALIRLGKLDAGESAARDALQVFRTSGNRRLTALALRTLATAPILRGDLETAGTLYREALALSQSVQDERGIQIISGNLAEIEAHAGNYDRALLHGREALEIARGRQDWVMVCTLLINVTAYLMPLDRFDEARSSAREALAAAGEIQSEMHLTVAIQHLAAVAAACGDAARAARLLGFVDAAYERLENSREPTEAQEYERAMAMLGERLPADELLVNRRAGALFTAEQAKSEALLT